MGRKLIALLATLALMLAILPNIPATEILDCCNGIMCPMHAAPHLDCGMDVHGSSAQLKPCPVPAIAHYTGANIFVLLAPFVLRDGATSEPAILLLKNLSSDAERRVDLSSAPFPADRIANKPYNSFSIRLS
jgi:hypothetical protein